MCRGQKKFAKEDMVFEDTTSEDIASEDIASEDIASEDIALDGLDHVLEHFIEFERENMRLNEMIHHAIDLNRQQERYPYLQGNSANIFFQTYSKTIEQITEDEILTFFHNEIKPFFQNRGLKYNDFLEEIKKDLLFYCNHRDPAYKRLRFNLLKILNDIINSPVFRKHFIKNRDNQIDFDFLISVYYKLDSWARCDNLANFEQHVKLTGNLIINFEKELNILNQDQKKKLFQTILKFNFFHNLEKTEWANKIEETIRSIEPNIYIKLADIDKKMPPTPSLEDLINVTKQSFRFFFFPDSTTDKPLENNNDDVGCVTCGII